MNTIATSNKRVAEIDVLKGVAILWVFMIHADAMSGSFLFTFAINRAVPVFLVLFGYTSSLWWVKNSNLSRRDRVSLWFRSRLVRLMIPVWAVVLLWWAVQVMIPPSPSPTEYARMVAALLGYMPWVGTGWFVTLILELVVLFPLVIYTVRRLGSFWSLVVAACLTALSYRFTFVVIHYLRVLLFESAPSGGLGGFFYFWIFPPTHLWHVVSGMALASAKSRDSPSRLLAAVGLAWLALVSASLVCPEPSLLRIALVAFADVPLALLLLAGSRGVVRLWSGAERVLTWFGLHSWGLFLGQLLVHNVMQSAMVRQRLVFQPEILASTYRFLALAIGAVVLVVLGNRLRSAVGLPSFEKRMLS